MAVEIPFEVDEFGAEVVFFRTRPDFDIDITVSPTEDGGGTITNVTATFDEEQPNVVITGGATSVNFKGTLNDPFEDVFYYVDKGKSDKTDTVKTVIGVDNVPPNKELFDLNQDTTTFYTKQITFVVTYEDAITMDEVEETVVMDYTIFNEYEGIRAFMASYY
jgi:hypothetical protein